MPFLAARSRLGVHAARSHLGQRPEPVDTFVADLTVGRALHPPREPAGDLRRVRHRRERLAEGLDGAGRLELRARVPHLVELRLEVGDRRRGEGVLEQHAHVVRAPEGFAQGVAEGAAEGVVGLDLLLLEEAPAVEGVLDEDALAEGVDGGDGCAVEAEEGRAEALARRLVDDPGVLALVRVGVVALALEDRLDRGAHPLAHLGCRLLGEGDDEDLIDGHAGEDQVHHQVLEGERLARAGRRLDDDVPLGGQRREHGGAAVAAHLAHGSLHSKKGPKRRRVMARASAGCGMG